MRELCGRGAPDYLLNCARLAHDYIETLQHPFGIGRVSLLWQCPGKCALDGADCFAVAGGQNCHHSGGTSRGDTQGQLLAKHQRGIGLRSHDTVANCQPNEVSVGLADNFSQQNVIYRPGQGCGQVSDGSSSGIGRKLDLHNGWSGRSLLNLTPVAIPPTGPSGDGPNAGRNVQRVVVRATLR